MSYYSIDAILTDAQKIPCTFELPIPGLGYLDDNPGGDIKPRTPLLLPLWLAELLAVQRLGPSSIPVLSLDLPSSLSPRVLNALKADPKTVDLRSLEVHFYEGAARVLELFEEEEVGDVLTETFLTRAREIGDFAGNVRGLAVSGGGGGEGEGFLRGLEEWERRLFRAAHDGSKALRIWMGEMKKKR